MNASKIGLDVEQVGMLVQAFGFRPLQTLATEDGAPVYGAWQRLGVGAWCYELTHGPFDKTSCAVFAQDGTFGSEIEFATLDALVHWLGALFGAGG